MGETGWGCPAPAGCWFRMRQPPSRSGPDREPDDRPRVLVFRAGHGREVRRHASIHSGHDLAREIETERSRILGADKRLKPIRLLKPFRKTSETLKDTLRANPRRPHGEDAPIGTGCNKCEGNNSSFLCGHIGDCDTPRLAYGSRRELTASPASLDARNPLLRVCDRR